MLDKFKYFTYVTALTTTVMTDTKVVTEFEDMPLHMQTGILNARGMGVSKSLTQYTITEYEKIMETKRKLLLDIIMFMLKYRHKNENKHNNKRLLGVDFNIISSGADSEDSKAFKLELEFTDNEYKKFTEIHSFFTMKLKVASRLAMLLQEDQGEVVPPVHQPSKKKTDMDSLVYARDLTLIQSGTTNPNEIFAMFDEQKSYIEHALTNMLRLRNANKLGNFKIQFTFQNEPRSNYGHAELFSQDYLSDQNVRTANESLYSSFKNKFNQLDITFEKKHNSRWGTMEFPANLEFRGGSKVTKAPKKVTKTPEKVTKAPKKVTKTPEKVTKTLRVVSFVK